MVAKNPKKPEKPKKAPVHHTERTSRHIAIILLGLYGGGLLGIGIAATVVNHENPDDAKLWADLFKSGFLILGGGLTAIIGYYFGSRGTHEAQNYAAIAEHKAEADTKQAQKDIESTAPTFGEDDLETPDDRDDMETKYAPET